MKRSTMAFVLLMPLLGLLPLSAAFLSKTGLGEQLAAESIIVTSSPTYMNSEDLQSRGEPDATEAIAGTVIQVARAAITEDPTWLGLFGAFNTAATGWFAMFLRRREKVDEKVKIIRDEIGDLSYMPTKEFVILLFKSITSWREFNRLLFRTNRQYSVYGFSHVSLVPKGAGRPMQWLDRTNRSAGWILEAMQSPTTEWLSKERSLTALTRAWSIDRAKAVGFMQDDDGTARCDYKEWLANGDWRSDPSRVTDPNKLIQDMAPSEFAVSFVFQMNDTRQETFTLLGNFVDVPETLEQWEELIMAFKHENKLVLKEAILLSALAIHRTVD